MKKIILITFLVISSFMSYSQSELWGINYYGSQLDLGGFFSLDASNVFTERRDINFENDYTSTGRNGLTLASNGKIYASFGSNDVGDGGGILEIDPVTDEIIDVFSFEGQSITRLNTNLVEYNGLLYGACYFGGANGFGGFFSFDPVTRTMTTLADFDATNRYIITQLEMGVPGQLFFNARPDYPTDEGLFSYDIGTNTITRHYTFVTNASNHYNNLTYVNGVFYSATSLGGANNQGYIYSWDATNGFQIRKDISSTVTGPIIDKLVYDAARAVFYSTSWGGGANGDGVLIQFDPSNDSITVLHDYLTSDLVTGGRPSGQPTLIGDHLYILTPDGDNGRWHRYHIPTATMEFIQTIDNYSNSDVLGQGVAVGNNIFFFTDSNTDGYGNGGLVKLNVPTFTATDLSHFGALSYGSRCSGVVQELDRHKLFYSSGNGGFDDEGLIAYYNVIEDSIHVITDLNYVKTGYTIEGKWVQANNGLHYKGVYEGGVTDGGFLYRLNAQTDQLDIVHEFDYTPGGFGYPTGSMVKANNGLLYGVCWDYDIGDGQMFSYDPINDTMVGHHLLNASIGGPYYGLTGNGSDTLYGVNFAKGANNLGCIYMYDIPKDTAILVYDFVNTPTTGYYPETELTLMADGKFMGVCRTGMQVFTFDPATNSVTFTQQNLGPNLRTVGDPTLHSNGKAYFTHALWPADYEGSIYEFDPILDTVIVAHKIAGSGPNYYHFQDMSLAEYMPCTPTSSSFSISACGAYTSPSGKVWAMSGIYIDTIPNADLCDSVITINLTIGNDSTYNLIVNACDSYTFASTTYTATGIYTDSLISHLGCDSIVVLDLTINAAPPITVDTTFAPTTCGGTDGKVVLNGGYDGCAFALNSVSTGAIVGGYLDTITSLIPTTYGFIIIDSNTCQSPVDSFTVDFGVENRMDTTVACNSYTWIDGNIYLMSGDYKYLKVVAGGCDTLIDLNLTINNSDTSVSQSGSILTATATATGTYQWLDCDNNMSVISGETNSSYTATVNGSYAVAVTQNGCTNTSSCHNIASVGIDAVRANTKIKIIPNPSNGKFQIEGQIDSYKILNVNGKVLQSKVNTNRINSININILNQPKGVYFIQLIKDDQLYFEKIVKH